MTQFQIYPETELACKYNKPLYKTQHSEILVEYEDGFDMNTGKLIRHEMATSRSTTDENSCPSKTSKEYRKNWWKIETTRQRQYTFTRLITRVQHPFWRNPL